MVIEDDGSALACALTCASLALANGSIPMYDLVIGSSLVLKHAATLLLVSCACVTQVSLSLFMSYLYRGSSLN